MNNLFKNLDGIKYWDVAMNYLAPKNGHLQYSFLSNPFPTACTSMSALLVA